MPTQSRSFRALTVLLAPLFVKVYETNHAAPFLVNMAILVGLLAYAYLDPILKTAGLAPASEDDATVSILERTEEGGGV